MNTFSKQRTTSLLTGLYSQLVFQSLKFLKNHKKKQTQKHDFQAHNYATNFLFFFFFFEIIWHRYFSLSHFTQVCEKYLK